MVYPKRNRHLSNHPLINERNPIFLTCLIRTSKDYHSQYQEVLYYHYDISGSSNLTGLLATTGIYF